MTQARSVANTTVFRISAKTTLTACEGWKLFDVTPIVQAQLKAGRKGNGVMLRFLSEDWSGEKKNWSGYAFVSREGAGDWANRTPRLLVVKPAEQ